MGVYLLHSSVSLVRSNGEAVRHYLGHCPPGMFPRRFHEHETNRHSSKIVQAFLAKGAILSLGNYWPGRGIPEEQQMKRNGHLPDKCLVCQLETLTREWMAMTNLAVSESEFDGLLPAPLPYETQPPSTTMRIRGNGSSAPRRTAGRTSCSATTRRGTPRGRPGTSRWDAPARPNVAGSRSASTRR